MRFHVITLMPQMFDALLSQGVVGRAIERGLAELRLWNPRDYTTDVHRTVDDRPYGGGPGMLMKYEPLRAAIDDVKSVLPQAEVVYLSPQGRRFDQHAAREMADSGRDMILLSGRYEGIDERIVERYVDREWSIGDYVLSGGELPAMVVLDAVIRLLPGVLGAAESAQQDSFMAGLLDCPHYTRPESVDGMAVPQVLQSGNHERIRRWRLGQALRRTLERRPELLRERELSSEETTLLTDIRAASGDAD